MSTPANPCCKWCEAPLPPGGRSTREFCPGKSTCRVQYLRDKKKQEARRAEAEQTDRDREQALRTLQRRIERGESIDPPRFSNQPRECHCNSSHVLYWDEDGESACLKCGGSIRGDVALTRMRRERADGKSSAQIAMALNTAMVPMALEGELVKVARFARSVPTYRVPTREWTAGAVERVLADGAYLPKVRR